MNTITRVYRHPVAMYYNRDGSLAFIRYMCFQCTLNKDRLDTCNESKVYYLSQAEQLPLMTLPDINNSSLFSYIDVPAKRLYANPKKFLIEKRGGGALVLRGVHPISRLYIDGEVISQAFQVLGCFDNVGAKPLNRYKFRSEYDRSGEPRLLIFDHTLQCRYIALKTLMQLKNHINIGNMDFDIGASLGRYCACPLSFKDFVSVDARDGLGIIAASSQKTNTREVELRIDGNYVDDFLAVPDTVERLIVKQESQTGAIKSITCPSSMVCWSVQTPSLRNFVVPKICAKFTLDFCVHEPTFAYTEQLFPEVLKPMGSEVQTFFSACGISGIAHDFSGYSYLYCFAVHSCSFTSDTDTLVLPVASEETYYSNIILAPHIKTVCLYKNTVVSGGAANVVLDFAEMQEDIKVIVECDIKYLEISVNKHYCDYNACLTIGGEGKVSRGTISCHAQVDLLNPLRHNFIIDKETYEY